MDPKNISIAGFRYDLPQERIAHYPLAERDSSKLLVYREGVLREDIYRNLGDWLPERALLIFNDTKVVEARIVFQKASGARIELFCLEPPPEYGNITQAMQQTGKIRWKCLIGGASKWKPGQVLSKRIDGEPTLLLEARWIGKLDDCFLIELSWSPPDLSFAELLHRAGLIPLPPYLRRAAEGSDQERYQTVYALHDGSVAAPTAGLHFTPALFKSLGAKNIQRDFVTLHVGAGTFMPVKSAVLGEHTMHAEFIVVRRELIEKLLAVVEGGFAGGGDAGGSGWKAPGGGTVRGQIIPVGTTSLRTIESLYWLGLKTIRDQAIRAEDLVLHQWDAYEAMEKDAGGKSGGEKGADKQEISSAEALRGLLDWMDREGTEILHTKTQLLITPGYRWKLTSALITNFHQPESTLLLLIAALVGESWKDIYRYALDHGFRFLSYGDGSLLFRQTATGIRG